MQLPSASQRLDQAPSTIRGGELMRNGDIDVPRCQRVDLCVLPGFPLARQPNVASESRMPLGLSLCKRPLPSGSVLHQQQARTIRRPARTKSPANASTEEAHGHGRTGS